MNVPPEGKRMIGKLMNSIDLLINDVNWDPKNIHGDSRIEFIEAKALLIYTKRKLKSISKREKYER